MKKQNSSLTTKFRRKLHPTTVLTRLCEIKAPSQRRDIKKFAYPRLTNEEIYHEIKQEINRQHRHIELLQILNQLILDPYAMPKSELCHKLRLVRRAVYPPQKQEQDYGPESVVVRLHRVEQHLNSLLNKPANFQVNYCDIQSHKMSMINQIDPQFFQRERIMDYAQSQFSKLQEYLRMQSMKNFITSKEFIFFEKMRKFVMKLLEQERNSLTLSDDLIAQFKKIASRHTSKVNQFRSTQKRASKIQIMM